LERRIADEGTCVGYSRANFHHEVLVVGFRAVRLASEFLHAEVLAGPVRHIGNVASASSFPQMAD
jgi:hypothetical protein